MKAARIAGLLAGPTSVATYGQLGLIGGNFWGVNDYLKDYAFADLVKTSRGFKPVADPYGTTDVALNAQGWPTQDFVCVLLAAGIASDAGVYQASFTGTATVELQGGNPTLSAVAYNAGTNTSTFTVTAPANVDSVQVKFTGLSSDFADLKVTLPGYSPVTAPLFRSEFLAHISTASTLRFMDWMVTNNSTDTTWSTGLASQSASRWKYRNSLAAAVDLCNETAKDCWVNVPHKYDDAGIAAFVSFLAGRIAAGRKCYVEFSNETWNTQFGQYSDLMAAMKAAASVRSSTADLVSCSKASGTATLVFSAPHGRATNNTIYVAGITNITGGTVVVTAVDSVTLTWAEAGTATGTINASDNSYVYLVPTNQWCKPLTGYGVPTLVPDIYDARVRYIVDRCRVIHSAIQSAGIGAVARVALGIQLGVARMAHVCGYATTQYGSASWLTVCPAYYTQPATPSTMTTEAAVFSQMEATRAEIAVYANQTANALACWGIDMVAYEGGPHTDSKPNTTVATAIRAAHLSDTMRVFIKNLLTDWRNRGGTLFNYYTYGASNTFDGLGNNTWDLIEGVVTDTTQAKFKAIVEQSAANAAPAQISGVTWGTIPLTAAWNIGFANGDGAGNKILDAAFVVPDLTVLVVAAAAGTYTLTIRACSNGGASDWITILVNGSVVASQVATPSANPFNTTAPQLWTGAVSLAAGFNRIALRPKPTTRAGFMGFNTMTLN